MQESKRLIYLSEKSDQELNELWNNCFAGEENQIYVNRFHPSPTEQNPDTLFMILKEETDYKSWLIKRKDERDIIGYIIWGEYIPSCFNEVGFIVGLDYVKNGYATEALKALNSYLDNLGINMSFAHCSRINKACRRVLEKCSYEIYDYPDHYFLDGNTISYIRSK